MAVVIQRHWRGYRTRRAVTTFVLIRVNVMWKNHYGLCATRIQSAWRGYRTRKHGPQLNRIKEWLTSVYEKNEIIQLQMQSFRNGQLEDACCEIDTQSLRWLLFILFKVHHLLGTQHRPSVVSSVNQSHSRAIEKMIGCLEYSRYMKNKKMKDIGNCVDDLLGINCSDKFGQSTKKSHLH